MYAVVEISGKQYKVTPKATIIVPTLRKEVGSPVTFDRVLLIAGEKDITVGHPLVAGATVQGTVVDHVKGEKVTVFKKKRRKGYRVKRGHRQAYTQVQITNIAS